MTTPTDSRVIAVLSHLAHVPPDAPVIIVTRTILAADVVCAYLNSKNITHRELRSSRNSWMMNLMDFNRGDYNVMVLNLVLAAQGFKILRSGVRILCTTEVSASVEAQLVGRLDPSVPQLARSEHRIKVHSG